MSGFTFNGQVYTCKQCGKIIGVGISPGVLEIRHKGRTVRVDARKRGGCDVMVTCPDENCRAENHIQVEDK